jgi:hypothetical protein
MIITNHQKAKFCNAAACLFGPRSSAIGQRAPATGWDAVLGHQSSAIGQRAPATGWDAVLGHQSSAIGQRAPATGSWLFSVIGHRPAGTGNRFVTNFLHAPY